MKIQILIVVACTIAVATAATQCQQEHLTATNDVRRVGAFVPKCEEDGTYSEMQCHGSTGMCWCSREDGTKINEPARGKYQACTCVKHRDNALQHKLIGKYIPQCQETGHFEKSQCWGSVGACWCVDEKTGAKVSNNPWDC